MDIFSKVFWGGGLLLGLMWIIILFYVLGTAEDGMLTVEGMEPMADSLREYYEFMKIFIYPWMALGIFLFIRFLMRMFGIGPRV
jgi:hypothetical protein